MLPKRRGRPTLEAYEVLFELARGGMGVVYAARPKAAPGDLVAIKLMSETAIDNRKHVDMFLDEARIASCVRDANVVEVLDAGEHEGLPFLVMEYVPGVSLLEVMRASEKAPVDVVCAILARAARGLHAAHETLDQDGVPLHIVHRDVSPHNVLVGFDGRVKVTDFGVAAARGRRTQTTSGEIKGKVSYMSPEQITREQTTDRRADVWALGVVAWEAIAGRKLFKGTDDAQRMFAVLRDPIPALADLAPDAPVAVTDLVMRALARNPDERVATAEDFARGIDSASATTETLASWMHAHFAPREQELRDAFGAAERREPTAVTAVFVPRVEPRARRLRAPAIAIALLALVAVGLAFAARAPEPAVHDAVARLAPATVPITPAPQIVVAPAGVEAPPVEETIEAPPPDARPRRSSRRSHPPATTVSSPPPSAAPADRRAASRLLDNPFAHP